MTTIILSKIVPGTSTNESGNILFIEMDRVLSEGGKIRISLENCKSLSTSFLSSSFGEIYDRYGYDTIKSSVTLTNYSTTLAGQIKSYLDQMHLTQKA